MSTRPERVRHTGRGAPVDDPRAPAPTEQRLPDGQHTDHWILSDEERAKGFVRPVRLSYKHVGPPGPAHPLRDLTDEQAERYDGVGYVKFEEYPKDPERSAIGRYWTQEHLDAVGKGCGAVTSMPQPIAETYAREPGFYGSTFCATCCEYLPVGARGEFVWLDDGTRVGT